MSSEHVFMYTCTSIFNGCICAVVLCSPKFGLEGQGGGYYVEPYI